MTEEEDVVEMGNVEGLRGRVKDGKCFGGKGM